MPTLNELAFKNLQAVNRHLAHKDHFTFVFLGDSRNTASNPINKKVLDDILDQINKLPETPAFVLQGGDLAYQGTVSNLKQFRGIIEHHPLVRKKKVPFFALPGNHEVYLPNNQYQFSLRNFREIIGSTRFVISIPKFKFNVLGMNNVTSLKPDGTKIRYGFSNNALNFMDAQIHKNKYGRTAIAFHTPPNFGCWADHGMDQKQTDRFLKNVVDHHTNQIPLVLVNHIHAYSFKKKDGVPYILSGGAGAPLVSKEEYPCTDPVFNFTVFKVTKHSVTGTVYKKKGNDWVKSIIHL